MTREERATANLEAEREGVPRIVIPGEIARFEGYASHSVFGRPSKAPLRLQSNFCPTVPTVGPRCQTALCGLRMTCGARRDTSYKRTPRHEEESGR
jgi:hypothetical protein